MQMRERAARSCRTCRKNSTSPLATHARDYEIRSGVFGEAKKGAALAGKHAVPASRKLIARISR